MSGRRSRVEIDPKLRRLFQRMEADVSAPVKKELVESGHRLFDAAARGVPRDTGELRQSLGLRGGAFSVEVGFDPKRFPAQWKVAGWRAHFVHNGTKGSAAHNIPPQPSRPFLRNAWDRLKGEIMDRQRQAVADALKKTSGG